MKHPLESPALGILFDRATGGADVAVSPNVEVAIDSWSVASAPAGISAATEWFTKRIEESDSSPSFLFLVGGPGGGKSQAASALVRNLDELDPPAEGLAHRHHRYKGPKRTLTLVNDATISSETYESAPLSHEISDALEAQTDFIACINRGILVEELSQLTSFGGASKEIITWLGSTAKKDYVDLEPQPASMFVKSAILRTPHNDIQVVAVYVDVCSLFEVSPQCSMDQLFPNGESDEPIVEYKISRWKNRHFFAPEECIAGELLEKVVTELAATYDTEGATGVWNPLYANVQNLKNVKFRSNVLSIARAAEIATGQRFTYREIWGLFSRLIIGDAPKALGREGIANFADPCSGDDAMTLFLEYRERARFRVPVAAFGGIDPSNSDLHQRKADPVLRLMTEVDPLRDTRPGELKDDKVSGWATLVEEVFSGPTGEQGPVRLLLSLLPETDAFITCVTEFDLALDDAYQAALSNPEILDSARAGYIRWYSAYLYRFYAISNGIPAFAAQIDLWSALWAMSPQFPSTEIERKFGTLLRPPLSPDDSAGSSYLPVFDSRATPLSAASHRSILSIKTNEIQISTSRDGEELFLKLKIGNEDLAQIVLDYALVREVDTHFAGHRGITELSTGVAPRLERVRAASLKSVALQNHGEFAVVGPNGESPLVVQE